MLDSFIIKLRKRLNQRRLLRDGAWACLVGTVVALAYALSYLMSGYAVPWFGYFYCILIPVLVGVGISWCKRSSLEQSVRYADTHFELKDVLTSAWHFQRQDTKTDAHLLVIEQSEMITKDLSVESVSLRVPSRMYLTSALLLAIVVGLAFLPASQAVLDAQLLAQQVSEQSEATRELLEEALDKLEQSLDEEEAEAIDLEALRQAVDELEVTEDSREAMRQLARIEQQVSEQIAALEQRSDEASAEKMATALEKVPNKEARQLAEDLKAKEYKQAAEKLKAMSPAKAKLTELSEQQKELARLRALTKPMAQAVADQNKMDANSNSMKQSDSENENGERQQQTGKEQRSSEQAEQKQSMASLAKELDENAQEMEGQLEQQALQQSTDSEQSEAAASKIQQSLNQMSDQLSKMQARRSMQSKLASLRQMLSQAQGQTPGKAQGQMPGLAQQPGGEGAGEGTDNTRRNVKDELIDNGQISALQGQKNEGPSLSKIEDASSGTGVSNRTGTEAARAYQRQFESFVQRDDIPDSVKFAVGDYFESIHQFDPILESEPGADLPTTE